jgi:phosphoribosylanthranilate isomerase
MSLSVKICGLSTEETIASAIDGGADYVGFVFYPKSPRAVSPSRAGDLARGARRPAKICGLFVDADDATFERTLAAVPLDILQLHGSEPPERCAQLRDRFRRPIMKAIGVGNAEDLYRAEQWIGSVDILLFDAKPTALPGGNGAAFDWRLLAGRSWPVPWLLAGGLTADTLRDAAKITGAPGVDVSSGVETSPGIKDIGLIRDFLRVAKTV